ncbi:MAG: BLUF domain-containing protein [Bacteroidetes bacterium]|nr:BLUF domain-containing protein [Bacteroidota bacterium]
MDLHYIIYSSTPAKAVTKSDIEQLLLTSRRNNALFGITGMLICLPELFMQFIEGPKENILQLFDNIEKDNRHYNVTVLKEGPLYERHFAGWSMGVDYREMPLKDFQQTFSVFCDEVFSLFNVIDIV